jgi:hypothetical protein
MQFLGEGGRQGHPADAGVANGRLSGHDRFFQDTGNAGVHVRQMAYMHRDSPDFSQQIRR